MPWKKSTLRGTAVFARARDDGTLDVDGAGLVDVRYQNRVGAKLYRARAANLEVAADAELLPDDANEATSAPRGQSSTALPADAVVAYTDGACSGNPGPMGVGVVVLVDGQRHEHGHFLGSGTNNIAELAAIGCALDVIERLELGKRPIYLHSDSGYAIGLLASGWKAKANVELVAELRARLKQFPRVTFVKVAGHAGVVENERADALAREAVKRGA